MSVPRSIKDPIATQLQVDPGEIFFVVDSLSDGYANQLRKKGVTDGSIFSTVNAAYAACTDNQDDVVAVKPGLHILSADLAWSKSHTHLVGRGGPVQEGDTYCDGTVITSGVDIPYASLSTITVTGAQDQFHNVLFEQPQAAATAVTACTVKGPSAYFKNVAFAGMLTATQDTGTTSSSLEIGASASYGMYVDCTIGSPLWDIRSAVNGQILFSNTSAATVPQDITFVGCRILNQSVTATNPAVRLTANYAVDRLLEFRDCTFYNFQESTGTPLTSGVFLDACGTSHRILISGLTATYGWNNWADTHTYIFASTPVGSATGGQAIVTT